MKRFILALGIGWALIYATNHFLLPPASSSFESSSVRPDPTDRSIDSWSTYLPHAADMHKQPQRPTSQLRQSQEVAALRDGDKKSAKPTASTLQETERLESKTGVTPDRFADGPAQQQPPSRKTEKSSVFPGSKGRAAYVMVDENPQGVGSERKRRGVGLFMFAPPGF